MRNARKKKLLKIAIKDISSVMQVADIEDLHPETMKEIGFYVHQIQNILIAEYARYTSLRKELGLR